MGNPPFLADVLRVLSQLPYTVKFEVEKRRVVITVEEKDMPQDNEGQEYVVTVDFVDAQGRTWSTGTVFTGDGEAVAKALKAGRISARPKPVPHEPPSVPPDQA